MTKTQVIAASGAILSAILGGAIVWSYMTFTIVERNELKELREAQNKLGECTLESSNTISELEKAKAELTSLKEEALENDVFLGNP